MSEQGLLKDILADSALLSKCTARHAGRVALQLLASWMMRPRTDSIMEVWCGELPDVCHLSC